MSTWTTIYGSRVDGDPVVAKTQPFYEAAQHAQVTARNVDYISDHFRDIRFGDSDGFRGATAGELASKTADWQRRIDPSGAVFADIASILDSHAEQLSRLRSQAAASAGRAVAIWKLKNAADARAAEADRATGGASQEVSAAQRTLDTIRYQIRALVPGSPDTAILLPNLRDKERTWEGIERERAGHLQHLYTTRNKARSESRTYADQLEDWLSGGRSGSWRSLRRREEDLNDRTAGRIRSVNLRGAANPDLIHQWVHDFVDFLSDAIDVLDRIAKAALKTMVHVLKIVLVAIAIIILAVIVIALVVAVIYLVVVVVAYVAAAAAVVADIMVQLAARVIASVVMRQVLRFVVRSAVRHLVRSTVKDLGLHGLAEVEGWMHRHVWCDAPTASRPPRAGTFSAEVLSRNRSDPAGTDTYQANQVFRELDMDASAEGHRNQEEASGSIIASDGSVWHRMSLSSLSAKNIDTSLLNDGFTGLQATIYQSESGQIVVAYAGSVGLGVDSLVGQPGEVLKDWGIADVFDVEVGSFVSPLPTQQKQATELARLVVGAFGADHVAFTGHSLGGDLAAQSAMVTGCPAVTWNAKGVNTNDLVAEGLTDEAISTRAPQLIVNYEVSGEVLSTAENVKLLPNALGTSVVVPPAHDGSAIDRHGLEEFPSRLTEPGVLLGSGTSPIQSSAAV